MTNAFDVNPAKLIAEVKEELKKIDTIKAPAWAPFVKTGMHKERPPKQEDWWYIRAAAVLRAVYKLGPIGTSKLRTKYGGKRNMGVKPDHSFKGSGNIIRKVLQQLEKSGLLAKTERGVHKGRILTPKGKSLVDKAASKIAKQSGTVEEKEKVQKAEHKEPEHKKDAHVHAPVQTNTEAPQVKEHQAPQEKVNHTHAHAKEQ